MIRYNNLDSDVDESREFKLICKSLQKVNPEIGESRYAAKLARYIVCEALDYIWGIARKRGNILDKFGSDMMIRVYREEIDDIAAGLSDAITAAYNWFRWESKDELVLVNWLCRNAITESEAEQRRISAEKERTVFENEERRKESNRLRQRKSRSKKSQEQDAPVTCDTNVTSHDCHTLVTCDVTPMSQHNIDDNNNNNNQEQQKHVSCLEPSTPRPPISGSEALDETKRILREIPLPESTSAVCSPLAFREAMRTYFENDSRGNAVGLLNLPSGPEKYLTRLYIDLSPYPPEAIHEAIEIELRRPTNPEDPNDGKILQTMKRVFCESARIQSNAKHSEKKRNRDEKIQAESERERLAEEERKRDAADFDALCELLAEGTESDIESAIEERYPIANAVGGQRKMIEMNRRILRKRIRKKIKILRQKKEVNL